MQERGLHHHVEVACRWCRIFIVATFNDIKNVTSVVQLFQHIFKGELCFYLINILFLCLGKKYIFCFKKSIIFTFFHIYCLLLDKKQIKSSIASLKLPSCNKKVFTFCLPVRKLFLRLKYDFNLLKVHELTVKMRPSTRLNGL